MLKHIEGYKYKIAFDHMNVFATRNPTSSDLFIYCFSNRRLVNNMNSSLEVEVLVWNEAYVGKKGEEVEKQNGNEFRASSRWSDDSVLEVKHQRQYLN